ncbi:MAG: glutamyl-tRNA reductase, partial [Pedosphaera sp.]|nr:glutamyl-tRNA reductase [Pedosphaera sp.]
MPIVVIGLNHQTAPIAVRERFAFADSLVPETLARMKSEGLIQEGVILSTCNRVEIYAATDGNPVEVGKKLLQFLTNFHSYEQVLTDEIYSLGEPLSVQHLFKVACGLDSMVLGETEILGQLKKAY